MSGVGIIPAVNCSHDRIPLSQLKCTNILYSKVVLGATRVTNHIGQVEKTPLARLGFEPTTFCLLDLLEQPVSDLLEQPCNKSDNAIELVTVYKLLTACNKLVDIIKLVITTLFQQVRYSYDITILLQPCVVNLLTFLLYHDCIRLVRTTF